MYDEEPMMISTRNLEALSHPEVLRRICKSIATLDAILEPVWEDRYYSYNSRWDKGQEMASMRDGEGNFFFVLFDEPGVALKGYEKDSPTGIYNREKGKPWPGVLDHVPPVFRDFVNEPAFRVNDATFCVWRRKNDDKWRTGEISFPPGADPDGSERLLQILDGDPATFHHWAESYHEVQVAEEAIARIYRHEPVVAELLALLNPDVSLADLQVDLDEIGYPSV